VNGARIRLLEQRRDGAIADLRALRAQVAAGDVAEAEAERLRRRYEADVADALAAIEAQRAAVPRGRSTRRVWTGVVLFAVAAGAAVFALTRAVQPRADDGPLSGIAADVAAQGGVDLSTVTDDQLEAVVAANPDIISMRLALARRYVEQGDFSKALPHYLHVLDQGPNAEALMYVGWMTYLSGDASTGKALLERSLDLTPDNTLAIWFLANVEYTGLEDAASAVPLLQQVIDSGEAPDDIVDEARSMIDAAGGQP
jgi:cytochrome c-type biogenesis protein CcmH/NrfG